MNKEELKKSVSCIVLEDCYYAGRIYKNGESLTVKRFEFSPTCLVAVDKEGNPLKVQPKKLSTKAVKAAFSGSDEAFSETEKSADFPVIGKEDMEEATNSGAEDLSDDVLESDSLGDSVHPEAVVESTEEGKGASALV